MARLSDKQIREEVSAKGFSLVDASQYKNLKSPILIKCEKGHRLETNMYSFRKSTFRCPECSGEKVNLAAFNIEKQGERTIALDNSTQKIGLSIFDDQKLVYYILLDFSGRDYEERLLRIAEYLEDVIIDQWDPDNIVFEDVQFQSNYATYKKLSMLLGILVVTSMKYDIPTNVVSSNTWRSFFQITGDRRAAKAKAIELVQRMYNITVNDDVAEAILLGKYMSEQILRQKSLKKAF